MEVVNLSDTVLRLRGIAIGPGRSADVPLSDFQEYMRAHPRAGEYLRIKPSAPPVARKTRPRPRRRAKA